MIFIGEHWNRELWLEWGDMMLAMQWEGAGRTMSEVWYEWDIFRAEWFRALFYEGKDAGFTNYEKR